MFILWINFALFFAFSVEINSQSLEDTQVGYISQKYTLEWASSPVHHPRWTLHGPCVALKPQLPIFVQISESNPKFWVKVWTKKRVFAIKIRFATKARICPIAAWRSNNLHNPCNTIFCIKTMHSTIKNLFTQFERHIYFTRGGRQKSWRYLLKERYLSGLSHFKLTLLANDTDVWQMSVI